MIVVRSSDLEELHRVGREMLGPPSGEPESAWFLDIIQRALPIVRRRTQWRRRVAAAA